MLKLETKLINRIYYVNNGIIYKFGDITSDIDSHAVIISANTDGDNDKIEKIFVGADRYFLDILIEDGDKYASNTFTKTVHENEGTTGSTEMTYFDYYKFLCEKSIRKAIIDNVNLTYEDLISQKYFNRLNVPEFIIKQKGYTVKTGKTGTGSAADLIDFTKATYDTWKKEEAAKKINDAAIKSADTYGYKFTEDMYNTIKGKITTI